MKQSKKESISAKLELPSSMHFSLNDCNAVKRTGKASSVPILPSSSEMFPVTLVSESSYGIKMTHISITRFCIEKILWQLVGQ